MFVSYTTLFEDGVFFNILTFHNKCSVSCKQSSLNSIILVLNFKRILRRLVALSAHVKTLNFFFFTLLQKSLKMFSSLLVSLEIIKVVFVTCPSCLRLYFLNFEPRRVSAFATFLKRYSFQIKSNVPFR